MGMPEPAQVTPLPPFRYNWTGNDINGLQRLAATVYGYVPPSLAVADKLDRAVDDLVHAAGWQGAAAAQFRGAWLRDSAETRQYTKLMNAGGAIFDKVSVELAWIQNWWESLDPLPAKAYEKGRASALSRIKAATDAAAAALNDLSAHQLAPAARHFIDDPTISPSSVPVLRNSLRVSLGGLPQPRAKASPGKPLDQTILGSHTVTDLVGFGGAGAGVGGAIGGGIGLLGGPFAEISVPVGAGVGGAIGGFVGGVVGGIWGAGEDIGIW